MKPVKPRINTNGKGPVGFGRMVIHKGKGAQSQMLPSRHALNTLTRGDPIQRSIGNYAKLTPSGAGAPGSYADIAAMAEKGIDLKDE